jgi:SAM-dependent methyltransferase
MTDLGRDTQNLLLATSGAEVDLLNAEFYGRFPYPWRPSRLDRVLDDDFERIMLCQSAGDWQHRAIPKRSHIWIAGCGTNQAVITALRFPLASVIGSDLSGPSLTLAARTAEELSVKNLELRQESINAGQYRQEFDFILSTGVIHHTAEPMETLRSLSDALKPGGILELMVYNRFHRLLPAAFQKTIRTLGGTGSSPGNPTEMALAKGLIEEFLVPGQMKEYLDEIKMTPEEVFADALMQPVEYSYTVQSLSDLAASCNLEIMVPCVNIFDRSKGNITWNLRLSSTELRERYYALEDLDRWHITNLLMFERSPMLWFYLRRSDSKTPRKSEHEICNEFLTTRFVRTRTWLQGYQVNDDGKFRPVSKTQEYPAVCRDGMLGKLVNGANGSAPMRVVLEQHGYPTTFPEVNETRIRLTTCAFPYLKAVGSGG